MKFLVSVALLECLVLATAGFASPIGEPPMPYDTAISNVDQPNSKAAAAVTLENVVEQIANGIRCNLGLSPCEKSAERDVEAPNTFQQLGCALGITTCATDPTRDAVYVDGTKGHPLPAELIAVGRSLDKSIKNILCVLPATCPDNLETDSSLQVPSLEEALKAVRTAPVIDPIINLATCRLGLSKCDQ